MMKRLFRVFLLCFPLLLLLSVNAFAAIASGTWEGVTWSISDDGKLTIGGAETLVGRKPLADGVEPPSGSCIMISRDDAGNEERFASGGWNQYANQTKSIVIQNGVTRIQDYTFTGWYGDTEELSIPESVTVVEYYAFGVGGLKGLKKATIPARCLSRQGTWVRLDGVTEDGLIRPLDSSRNLEELIITGNAAELDKSVFEGYKPPNSYGRYVSALQGYENLKKVTFPNGLTTIWDEAFTKCSSLTEMALPESVTTIGNRAFSDCSNLKSINLPSNLTSIGSGAFSDCSNLKSINFPSSLTSTGNGTFSKSGFEEIIIPSNIASIGGYAFSNCEQLKKVILLEGVTTIEDGAFGFCMNLEEVTIPISVTSIGSNAFEDYRYDKTESHLGKMHFTVYYEGSQEQWEQVKGKHSDYLDSATVQYNSPMPVITPTTAPVTVTDNETAFADVSPNAYYADAVKWAVENGVTKGVSETSFAPDDTCTRGQVATFLWRAKGSPEPATVVNPFTDVDPSSAFYKAILWASENGITSGTSPTTFSPANPCTRAHVITFLWRSRGEPSASGDTPLTDSFPAGYYTNAVKWAESAGLLSGTGETFAPSALCPRADIVEYLYRVLK